MVAITAIGSAIPQYKQSQAKVKELMATLLPLNKMQSRILKTIYRETGIDYRHSVLADFVNEGQRSFFPNDVSEDFPCTKKRMMVYKENALGLALMAIQNCLATKPDFVKEKITHVITVSCTGMSAPGLDIEVLTALNLPTSTSRHSINFMGCYGVFNALKLAYAICKAEPRSKVLLISVELCTIHFQKNSDLDNLIASAIFSDGAGACLIEGAATSSPSLVIEGFYCDLLTQGQQEMTWDIGNYGFDIRLSSYVSELIAYGIGNFVNRLQANNVFSLKDIDDYAIHPGSKRILESCEKALKITPEHNQHSYEVLSQYGNMSSATILFILKKYLQASSEKCARKIFSCAFGPGLTLESALMTCLC